MIRWRMLRWMLSRAGCGVGLCVMDNYYSGGDHEGSLYDLK